MDNMSSSQQNQLILNWYQAEFMSNNRKYVSPAKTIVSSVFPFLRALPTGVIQLKNMAVPVKVALVRLKHSSAIESRVIHSHYHELQALMLAFSSDVLYFQIYYKPSYFYTNLIVYKDWQYEKTFLPPIERSFFRYQYHQRFSDTMSLQQFQGVVQSSNVSKHCGGSLLVANQSPTESPRVSFSRVKTVAHFHKQLYYEYTKGKSRVQEHFGLKPVVVAGAKQPARLLSEIKQFVKDNEY